MRPCETDFQPPCNRHHRRTDGSTISKPPRRTHWGPSTVLKPPNPTTQTLPKVPATFSPHDTIGKHLHARKLRNTPKPIHETCPLLFVKEERAMSNSANQVITTVRLKVSRRSHNRHYSTKPPNPTTRTLLQVPGTFTFFRRGECHRRRH